MNKYDKFQPFQIPFGEMVMASQMKGKAEAAAQIEAEDLQNQFVNLKAIQDGKNAFGEDITDTSEKNALLNEWNSKLKSIQEKYKYEPAKAIPEISALGKEIKTNLTYGKAAAIQARYDAQQADLANANEYQKAFVKSGGTKGTSKEQALGSFNYTAQRVRPLKQDEFGNWEGYGQSTYLPTIDRHITEKAEKIGKQMYDDAQSIERVVPYHQDPNYPGVWISNKTGDIVQKATVIEAAVKATFAADPEVQNYYDHLNTISGAKDRYNELKSQNFVITDKNGNQSQLNPDVVYDELFNNDINKLAKITALKYQRADHSEDVAQMHAIPGWKDPNDPSNQLITYDAPANVNKGLEVKSIELNPDGSVKESKNREGFLSFWESVGDPFGIASTTREIDKTVPDADKANANVQSAIDKKSVDFRLQFPYLNEKFPYKAAKNSNGQTYDKNSGQLINWLSQNASNNTTINKVLKPADPEKFKTELFKQGGFNDLIYRDANNPTLTKEQTLEKFGYKDGEVPTESIDKTKVTSMGTFTNPGYIYAKMPDSKGVYQQIEIAPDVATQTAYTHTNVAKEVYKNLTPQYNVIQYIDGKPYICDYTPSIDGRGIGVDITMYENNNGQKGKYVGKSNAFDVYMEETKHWAKAKGYSIK